MQRISNIFQWSRFTLLRRDMINFFFSQRVLQASKKSRRKNLTLILMNFSFNKYAT